MKIEYSNGGKYNYAQTVLCASRREEKKEESICSRERITRSGCRCKNDSRRCQHKGRTKKEKSITHTPACLTLTIVSKPFGAARHGPHPRRERAHDVRARGQGDDGVVGLAAAAARSQSRVGRGRGRRGAGRRVGRGGDGVRGLREELSLGRALARRRRRS